MIGRYLPSPAHVAGVVSLVLAAALAAVDLRLAVAPLTAFLAACLAAPFFPSWQFFLPSLLHGPRSRQEVALTFDDGPSAPVLEPLLALLARAEVPATFFVVGERAAARPDAVREILRRGHEIGNHSWSHDTLLMLRSAREIRSEIERCQRAVASIAGVVPLAFRPPVGVTNPLLRTALRAMGLECVMFSCRPLDFANRRLANLRGRVLRRVRPGDVILLHDWLPPGVPVADWIEEVEAILAGLREKGLSVVPLSRLLGRPMMRPAEGAEREVATTAEPRGQGSSLASIARVAFVVLYPLAVAVGVPLLGTRGAAALLLLFLVAISSRLRSLGGGFLGAVAVLLVATALLDDTRFMLAYPTVVNAVLLAQFAWSLRTPLPMVERFARMQVKDLRPEEVRYCRIVTGVWIAFFAVNGAVAAFLALGAPRSWWAVYTGAISYGLVGSLFAVEYVIRKARFGRFGANPIDRVLARAVGHARLP
jgi:peptidoglycan/xylan/chitin deacetylase (PgdA/CDA1 family)/uncharacterized membrane protein